MKIKDLNNEELQEVTELYVKERHTMKWLCSLEEFCESFIRKCESCGRLVVVDDGDAELPLNTNWKGEKYRACYDCDEELQEVSLDDYDEYDDYNDYKMTEEMR